MHHPDDSGQNHQAERGLTSGIYRGSRYDSDRKRQQTREQGRLAALVRAALLTYLTFEEATILKLRYGLGGAPLLADELAIADRLGLPFPVVRRRLLSAQRKLREIPVLRRAVLGRAVA